MEAPVSDLGAAARSDFEASRPASRRPGTTGGTPPGARPAQVMRVVLRADWTLHDTQGLLGSDPRVRTLRKVLVTYPDVRHIVPDRISFEATTAPSTIDTVKRFLERQQWLVKSVTLD